MMAKKGSTPAFDVALSPPTHFSMPAHTVKPSLLAILSLLSLTAPLTAVDFKKDIRPILEENCYECHSKEAGKEKAGYVFDDLETLKLDIQPKGIIVPNKPGESYLLDVITMDVSEKAHMPPKKMMSDRDIAKIREWISAGASLDTVAPGTLPARPAAALLDWTNVDGKTIKAGFVRLEGESVVLKLPTNGQEVPYPLSKLDAASQRQAREAAGAP